MTQHQLKATMGKVLAKIAKKNHIIVCSNFDLRKRRRDKQATAAKNNGWTLFVNKKGSLCHGVHKTGALLVLEAPDYFANCFSDVYATNYFVNSIKTISQGV